MERSPSIWGILEQGGRSPKPLNGPTSTSPLKLSSDSIQNNVSSFTFQVKGKKREQVDQGSEPVKREHSTKANDGDSGHSRSANILRSEISKITEKGGLVDFEGVEKFVRLMVPDSNMRKINLEVYKEKIGDDSNLKDGDKAIKEFLIFSLRALDKLPINLHALQMCNIGKSVNRLHTHKNLKIQKKAKSLVDKWKKRIEAEMDAKSGSNQVVSWPVRPRIPEVSHGGNRNSGSSSEVAVKSSLMQLSSSKTALVKLVQGRDCC